MPDNFSIAIEDGLPAPSLDFKSIKEAVLGADYLLSLVFVSDGKIRQFNEQYRDKDAATDILSFPLSEN